MIDLTDDCRVPLELEGVVRSDAIETNGLNVFSFIGASGSCDTYVIKFYYPTIYKDKLMIALPHYKDTLYSNMTTYAVTDVESILTIKTLPISDLSSKKTISLIKKILKDDNEALLNTMHSSPTIQALAGFKIKVFFKTKFSAADYFNIDPDEVLFYDD